MEIVQRLQIKYFTQRLQKKFFFLNFMHYILYGVTMEIVQRHVSDSTRITQLSKNRMVHASSCFLFSGPFDKIILHAVCLTACRTGDLKKAREEE